MALKDDRVELYNYAIVVTVVVAAVAMVDVEKNKMLLWFHVEISMWYIDTVLGSETNFLSDLFHCQR